MLLDTTGSRKSKMAADKPEVIIYRLHTGLFDIWTERRLFSFLKTNKTSTDNTINQRSKSLMYIFVMECTSVHLQCESKKSPP